MNRKIIPLNTLQLAIEVEPSEVSIAGCKIQIPNSIQPAAEGYFKAREEDLAGFLNMAREHQVGVYPVVDHAALRTVVTSQEEAQQCRQSEAERLSQDGMYTAIKFGYQPWKKTSIYGFGSKKTGEMMPPEYNSRLQNSWTHPPVGQASIFSTFYILEEIPGLTKPDLEFLGALIERNHLVLEPEVRNRLLESPAIPIEIKAIFLHQANGLINHVALAVRNESAAEKLLARYSFGQELNELQNGAALNQISTWDERNDYIEIVERNEMPDGKIHLHEFKLENTEPLFRSTALGVVLAFQKDHPKATVEVYKDAFPDAVDTVEYFVNHNLLVL